MPIKKINTALSKLSFGHKLPQETHKKMLEILKKMHAQDTLSRSGIEITSSAICALSTDTMNLKTLKMPITAQTYLTPEEFVQNGQTRLQLFSEATVWIDNQSGKIVHLFDDIKQGWNSIKQKLVSNIDFTLNNFDTPAVEKHTYTMRTLK